MKLFLVLLAFLGISISEVRAVLSVWSDGPEQILDRVDVIYRFVISIGSMKNGMANNSFAAVT